MLSLLDLPSDIINIAIFISNLDKRMLKSTSKLLYKIVPICPVFYDEPINSSFSANQLQLLLSPESVKRGNALLLAKNAIKRSRLDLLLLLKPFAADYDIPIWRYTAAFVGNLQVYGYIFNLKPPSSMDNDVMHALAGGHINIFDYLAQAGCTRRDKYGLAASIGAIKSGKLEIVTEIYDSGYMFGEHCISHANNLEIIKWLHGKGFVVGASTSEEMAKYGDLAAIKWFDEMKFFTKEKLFGYCLSTRFVDGMKYLLDNGCVPTQRQLESYDRMVEKKVRPWYEWLNSRYRH